MVDVPTIPNETETRSKFSNFVITSWISGVIDNVSGECDR
jgi:hypothetical protein